MKVELTYFKSSGKYYSHGSYEIPDETAFHQIISQVSAFQKSSTLPNLNGGYMPIVSIDCPDHPYNHPCLVIDHVKVVEEYQ